MFISVIGKCINFLIFTCFLPMTLGAVYWNPPVDVLEKVKELACELSTSYYGTHEGPQNWWRALTEKVLWTFYASCVRIISCTNLQSWLHPVQIIRLRDWLEKILSETKPMPKLVSLVNPGNPSGTIIPELLFKQISDICRKAGSWLVVDNACEYFTYDGLKPSCIGRKHVINLFSFSKAYGMIGCRVRYIAYSTEAEGLRTQLLKVQDNIAIFASIISQKVEALSSLESVMGGEGAIYPGVKLPNKYKDGAEVVRWLVHRHAVMLLPGSDSGAPGCVRITYGALREAECEIAVV
ncbi:Aminotransferase, class I/classII [Dillenia turbinata]|uniref:Aminotransferase, class I/classII n=1 Tax=Dillenia turbinata TaxID=194707 RepID=A0AAN8VDS5_9MAGN